MLDWLIVRVRKKRFPRPSKACNRKMPVPSQADDSKDGSLRSPLNGFAGTRPFGTAHTRFRGARL